MYASNIALEAIRIALQSRGFRWPESGAVDKDSVQARTMAFDALQRFTGMSRTATATAIGSSKPQARAIAERVNAAYRNPGSRDAWLADVEKVIQERIESLPTP